MNDLKLYVWDTLLQYVAGMQRAVAMWEQYLETREIDWLSREQIGDWLQRVRGTLDVLKFLHLYDDLNQVSVAVESSGFPSSSHVRELARLRERPNSHPSIRTAKRQLLESVLATGEVSVPMFERLMKSYAFTLLGNSEVLEPFRMMSLAEYSSTNERRVYVCVWERYVVQPLPTLYVMLFEVSGSWEPDGDDLAHFVHVLREESGLIGSLETLARDIDRAHAMIHPKWVGRIIGGPVLLGGVTNDSNPLQHALNQHVAPGTDIPMASRIIYEYVIADSESLVRSITDPYGNRHVCMQRYAVRSIDEYYDRGVTHLEKHLFAPHGVIQSLDYRYLKELNHTIHTF